MRLIVPLAAVLLAFVPACPQAGGQVQSALADDFKALQAEWLKHGPHGWYRPGLKFQGTRGSKLLMTCYYYDPKLDEVSGIIVTVRLQEENEKRFIAYNPGFGAGQDAGRIRYKFQGGKLVLEGGYRSFDFPRVEFGLSGEWAKAEANK